MHMCTYEFSCSLGSLFPALYSAVLVAHSFNTLNSGSSSSSANLQSVGMDLEVKLNEVEEEYRTGKMALQINETFWDTVLHSFFFY